MAWPSWMPLAARPAHWPDWSTIYRAVIPREWPRRLFGAGSQAYSDLIAFGESLALAREMVSYLEFNLWPQADTEGVFTTRWEAVFGLQPDGTLIERTSRIISTWRLRGTMTYALYKAIMVQAWNSDDPSIIEVTGPTIADIAATDTLGTNTWIRAAMALHLYQVAETSDPQLSLKNDILRRITPTWVNWTAGRYHYGLMGSSASNTVRSRYNGCVYDTRP